jgi:GTP pyrophosphokinase
MNSVKTDLFTDSIYVFTPKGDVRELVHDATPIDFAYAIHTDVGHHCMGAKVNGRIVPLISSLKNGDRVEVLTSPTHRPSKDWLKAVKTSLAKSKIKRFLVEQERARSLQIGRQLLERALRRERLSPSEVFKSEKLLSGVKEAGIKSLDDLFVAVGYGKISVAHLLHPLSAEPALKEKISDKIAKNIPFLGGSVRVQGISGLSAHMAKCCGPLPGDPIVGFVTRGMGMTIHTAHCPNIDRLSYDRERIVEEVEWGTEAMVQRVGIIVHTLDRTGILAQVSASISASGADIKRADIRTSQAQRGEFFFQIEVADTQHLAKTFRNIERVSGVLDVKRVWKGW